jgi:hypothetical protein
MTFALDEKSSKIKKLIIHFIKLRAKTPNQGGGGTNLGRQFDFLTKFFYLPPNSFGFTIWDIKNISFLGPTILRWTIDIWKRCIPLV